MDKNNNNRNNIDSEQNTFQRLETDLKNTIFGVNFILLKGQEISIYTAFVLILSSSFRLPSLPSTIQSGIYGMQMILRRLFEIFLGILI